MDYNRAVLYKGFDKKSTVGISHYTHVNSMHDLPTSRIPIVNTQANRLQ